MKPTVNKKTQEYLNQLEESEKINEKQENYYAQKDALDLYIEKNNLKIQRVFFKRN